MKIRVHLIPSNPEQGDPGHMAASWTKGRDEASPQFRGYVFKINDLPVEFRSAARWRDYLFDHVVPGYVINDRKMQVLVESGAKGLFGDAWDATPAQLLLIEMICRKENKGSYSFNPDDHPGSHNCVTWTVSTVNSVMGEVLPKVRQGRIKLMIEVLSSRGSAAEAS
ncbi:MAG: hypothetical protein Q8M07_32790 [Prosthecobacter sp.]|nr:hypothetical protein [Prosthecobacter sp.]